MSGSDEALDRFDAQRFEFASRWAEVRGAWRVGVDPFMVPLSACTTLVLASLAVVPSRAG